MRIAYIITTQTHNKLELQFQTFLKYIDKHDIYILFEQTRFYEFTQFFEGNAYDWYFFIDDNTFVFPHRLKTFLEPLLPQTPWYIGNQEQNHVGQAGQPGQTGQMSKKAGYLVSQSLFSLVCESFLNCTNHVISHMDNAESDILFLIQKQQQQNICRVSSLSSSLFSSQPHDSELSLSSSITLHGLNENSQFYRDILDLECTLVLLVTDSLYYPLAKETIHMLRTRGKWQGNIGVITLDGFMLPETDKREKRLLEFKFPAIDKSGLLQYLTLQGGFSGSDKRELLKTNQWEKLHVFDEFFLWVGAHCLF